MNGLGSIIVFLKADATVYNRVLDHAARTMDRTARGISGRLGTMVTDISQRMTALGRVLTYTLSSSLITFAAVGVQAFAKFDDAINRTVAISGESSNKIRRHLEVNAIALSKQGRQSAIDLANGYYYLVAAGLSAKESLEALATVERFATAGAFNLEDASSLLVDTQNVLGLRTKDTVENLKNMNKVADVLAKAGNITNASTEQFARALVTKSGAALRLLGKDMEEGVAVLSALAQQGTKAELAGEQMYIFLRDTQAAAQKNAETWNRLGISVYDADGQMRHVADVIEQLEMILSGVSDEQTKATMKMLGFTDRSVAATYSLLGLSGAIRDYEKAFRSANGDNVTMAAKRLESFVAGMIRIKNMIMAVAMDIARLKAPILTQIANKFGELLAWWDQLSDKGKNVVIIFGAVTAAIGPILLIIGSLGMTLGIVITGFSTLLATLGPAAAVLGGLGAGVAGALYYFRGREGLIAAFDAATAATKKYIFLSIGWFANYQENLALLLPWLQTNFASAWAGVVRVTKAAYETLGQNGQVFFDAAIEMQGALMMHIVKLWNALAAGLWQGMAAVGQTAITGLSQMWGAFTKWFANELKRGFIFGILDGINAAQPLIQSFFDWLARAVNTMGAAGGPEWEAFGNKAAQAFINGAQDVDLAASIKRIWGKLKDELKNPFAEFNAVFTDLPTFNFDMHLEKLEELDAEISKVHDAARELHDGLDEPAVLSVEVKGIDGIRKGSQDAELLFRQFKAGRAALEKPVGVLAQPFVAGAAAQEAALRAHLAHQAGVPVMGAGGAGLPDIADLPGPLEMPGPELPEVGGAVKVGDERFDLPDIAMPQMGADEAVFVPQQMPAVMGEVKVDPEFKKQQEKPVNAGINEGAAKLHNRIWEFENWLREMVGMRKGGGPLLENRPVVVIEPADLE
jgi:TP901 family phage tail tape measure protein